MKTLKEDWVRVHDLALDIVNADMQGNTRRCERKRQSLLRLLNLLERRHGPHPSVIATKADYLMRDADKVRELKRALKLADKLNDSLNMQLIREDLDELKLGDKRKNREQIIS